MRHQEKKKRERHIKYKKGDKRKGEREVKKAFFLMLFYFLLTPFLMHTKNIKKKFFPHIITRKILGELSPNCKNISIFIFVTKTILLRIYAFIFLWLIIK